MTTSETRRAVAERPFIITLLLGASGWAAGLCALLFVGLLFKPDSAGAAAGTGAILLAAAWGLFKVGEDNGLVFVAQLALALSIAGQTFLIVALSWDGNTLSSAARAALPIQVVLALAMPNGLSRLLSTLFATIAWALVLRTALGGGDDRLFGHVSADTTTLGAALGAWLLTWVPVAAALGWAVRREAAWRARGWASVVRPIVTGLIAGLAFATIASRPFEWDSWHASQDDGGMALWPLLSALAALGAVAAAFARRQRGLMALCAVAVLLHVVHFYQALGATLLVKSLLMLALGAACLAASRLVRVEEEAR